MRGGGGITVVDALIVLLRHRVMILGIALLLALRQGIAVIALPRFYSSEAQFMPQGASPQSQLAGVAQFFGVNVGGDGGDTPQFYMDLLKSRSILGEVVTRNYDMRTDSGVVRGNLIKLFGGASLPPRAQKPFAITKLASQIDVSVSARTGVITMKTRAVTAGLSAQIANNLLAEINAFNLNTRQRRAAAERIFVEKRQGEALGELRDAEGALQQFLTQNRDFARSPALQLEYNRLTREVTMRQTVYTSLASAYEQAKIEEVRDLPVITIVAPPEVPLLPESKHAFRKVTLSLLEGIALGSMLAFALAGFAAATRGRAGEAREFERLKHDAWQDLKHPWRPVGRVFSRISHRRAAA